MNVAQIRGIREMHQNMTPTNAKHTQEPYAVMQPDEVSMDFIGGHAERIEGGEMFAIYLDPVMEAAPAMLEALRAVAALANGQGRANLMEVAGQARQIIAQAEGGAQ